MPPIHLPLRMRRQRKSAAIRNILQETRLHTHQFIAPIIINETLTEKKPIASMPGQFQLSYSELTKEIEAISSLGIQAVLLFGLPANKDPLGRSSYEENGVIQRAIQAIREVNSELLIITDLCLCQYTDHGHCGALKDNYLDNDTTLDLLQKQTLSHVQAGADWVAPSGMIDGMIGAMRNTLDEAGYTDTAILSYAVKYCSHLYGPFAGATQGAAQFGDRKSYQMNPANAAESLREVALDLAEGADLLMVKPATHYLDIIYRIKAKHPEIPLCAYHVSGEYSSLKYGAMHGLFDEERAIIETLLSIKRAGADLIITYFAKDIARILSG